MIANRTVGRKQMVVTGVSALLAIGSCFIPLRDPPPPAASQMEQTVDPHRPPQQPASDPSSPRDVSIKILLAEQRTDQLNRAIQSSGGGDLTASDPPAVGASSQTGQSGAIQLLSPQDFHSGAPDLKLMQILPINQSGQF